jgi:hypothetical protein
MIRIQIKLTEDVFRALRNLADQEYRDFKQQAGILIKEGLVQRGLIQPETISGNNTNPKSRGNQNE